jgi:hypothetical protein
MKLVRFARVLALVLFSAALPSGFVETAVTA